MSVDYDKYREFVDGVTSKGSKDFAEFMKTIESLNDKGLQVERLLTGSVGISAEGGEIIEIVKKVIFQGKPWDEDTRYHLKRELGDVMWYVMQTAMALGYSLDEIVEENVEKLKNRYPGGEFSVERSENRVIGDL